MGVARLDEAVEYLSTSLDSGARSLGYSIENRKGLRRVIGKWRDELIQSEDIKAVRFRGIARWFLDADVTDPYLSALLSGVDNAIYDAKVPRRV